MTDQPRRTGGRLRTVRLRLTALYASLFLVCGATLLAITYVLVDRLSLSPPASYSPPGFSGNGGAAIAAARSAVLRALLVRSLVAFGIMAVVSTGLGWFVAGRILRPVRLMTARTRAISKENLHERLALAGPSDELTELGDTIDGLLEGLEDAFRNQRSFVANVSHELRTPLAMMHTSLDVAEAKPVPMSDDAAVLAGKIRDALEQADRLVESFLTLARVQSGSGTDAQPVPLGDLVREALTSRSAEIGDLGLRVHEQLEEADITGSRVLLSRLVANLVDNAVRHNVTGGELALTTGTEDGHARLTVANGGPLVGAAAVAALGVPFRRIGAERASPDGSVGMGLAIVGAVARAHGGTLELHPRGGGGLTAVVDLPLARENGRA